MPRSITFALLLPLLILMQSCSPCDSSSCEGTVTFDLRSGPMSSSLTLSNETLVFPLACAPGEHTLTESEPGDLVIAYTRVGCWIEPDEWIGAEGAVPVEVRPVSPEVVTRVTIDQDTTSTTAPSPEQFGESTCLSLRSPDGVWQPFLRPSSVVLTGGSVRAEFAVDAACADAAAFFLPHYTHVSRISYTLGAPSE